MRKMANAIARAMPPSLYILCRNLLEGGYREEIAMLSRALAEASGPALDIGCGSGEIEPRKLGGAVVGLDTDTRMLRHAARKGYRDLVCGHSGSLPFGDDSFGAAIMCKLVHHLNDAELQSAVNEALRALRPGGILVILDPFPGSAETTALHRLITSLEIGAHHRVLSQTREFTGAFEHISTELFRKRAFDFYMLVLRKPNPGVS